MISRLVGQGIPRGGTDAGHLLFVYHTWVPDFQNSNYLYGVGLPLGCREQKWVCLPSVSAAQNSASDSIFSSRLIYFVTLCMSVWVTCMSCTMCIPDACGGAKRMLDSLELELEMVMSHQMGAGK